MAPRSSEEGPNTGNPLRAFEAFHGSATPSIWSRWRCAGWVASPTVENSDTAVTALRSGGESGVVCAGRPRLVGREGGGG